MEPTGRREAPPDDRLRAILGHDSATRSSVVPAWCASAL